jgi:hypothetical protein
MQTAHKTEGWKKKGEGKGDSLIVIQFNYNEKGWLPVLEVSFYDLAFLTKGKLTIFKKMEKGTNVIIVVKGGGGSVKAESTLALAESGDVNLPTPGR